MRVVFSTNVLCQNFTTLKLINCITLASAKNPYYYGNNRSFDLTNGTLVCPFDSTLTPFYLSLTVS